MSLHTQTKIKYSFYSCSAYKNHYSSHQTSNIKHLYKDHLKICLNNTLKLKKNIKSQVVSFTLNNLDLSTCTASISNAPCKTSESIKNVVTFCVRAGQHHKKSQCLFPAAFIHPEPRIPSAPSLECLSPYCLAHLQKFTCKVSGWLCNSCTHTVDTPAFNQLVWPTKATWETDTCNVGIGDCFVLRGQGLTIDLTLCQCDPPGHFREIHNFCNKSWSSRLCR